MDRSTIEYYNRNAAEYAEKTRYVYMHDTRTAFLDYVDPDARIADIGCGGGRDKKIFEELGYIVDAIDASPEMCEAASEYTEDTVQCCDINEWTSRYSYGGIWCCASLLHLKEEEFFAFFRKAVNYLDRGGALYFSMKKGIADGYDDQGRYYLSFDDERMKRILAENPEYIRAEYWETADNMNRDIAWINVILKKR
ncbi:MAG: class I SAM-dependent methyltransferase [Clostridiales bacterium]|nr:class I SAM-dependent methyltransferase [Clostridiales bacterium]